VTSDRFFDQDERFPPDSPFSLYRGSRVFNRRLRQPLQFCLAGLAALIWSDLIAEEARTHSKDMADKTVPFGHDGFSDRFARITRAIPADAGAENIAYGPDADTVFRIWADSAGHRAHIVGNFDFTGVGVAWDSKSSSFYCTQIFIRSR
jgi:uncharacterized protein YkwD